METNETLLIITPPRNKGLSDTLFHLIVAETGEHLASHLCSNYCFAYNDLYGHRTERIDDYTNRFGNHIVKFIDDTDISEDELIDRNHKWFEQIKQQGNGN